MLMKATGDNASIRVVIASIDYFGVFLNRDFSPVWIVLFPCQHWLLVNKLYKELYFYAEITGIFIALSDPYTHTYVHVITVCTRKETWQTYVSICRLKELL